MNFSSINFDSYWKLLSFLPVSRVIYNDNPLLVIYQRIPYWNILARVENLQNSKKFIKIDLLKYKVLEEEFKNSSWNILLGFCQY